MRFFHLLLLIALTGVSPFGATRAADLACRELFFPSDRHSLGPYEAFIDSLEETRYRPKDAIATLVESKPFRKFLHSKWILNFDAYSSGEQLALIREYMDQFFLRFGADSLGRLQEQDLRTALKLHGFSCDECTTATEALERLSATNLARVLNETNSIRSIPQSSEGNRIRDMVKKIELRFRHHGNNSQDSVTVPLLSAGQLENMGLMKWALNLHPFNVNLGAPHSVFFIPFFIHVDRGVRYKSAVYGRKMLVPSRNYMLEHGWVSAFIMYSDELKLAAKYTNPEIALTLTDNDNFSQKAIQARESLHKLDFTARDYETLVRKILSSSLLDLLENNPYRYKDVMQELERGDNLESHIRKLVILKIFPDDKGNFQNGLRFEGKIPTAVPRDQILSIRRDQ